MTIAPEVRAAAIAHRRSQVDSPILDRQRREAEVWSAVVLWDAHPEAVSDAWLDGELGRIAALGFQAVRFHGVQPRHLGGGRWDASTAARWLDAADRAGLRSIIVGEVFHHPPATLLDEHRVARSAFDAGWLDDPRHQAVVAAHVDGFIRPFAGRVAAWCILGEPQPGRSDLQDPARLAAFAGWLERRYGDLDALWRAWRVYNGTPPWSDWLAAASAAAPGGASLNGVSGGQVCYGARCDLARFLADRENARARVLAGLVRAADPQTPVGVGSHQLAINQPKLGWDIGGWAGAGDLHTTSIHLSWHFDAVAGEVDLPVWLQARQTRDYRKSGFSSAFETTGGAVQFSGGYGNHMDAGLMRRLCLAYLAAGNQSMAFWSWNARPGGWEQGEYGMLGLSGVPMPWAHEAGRIATAMQRWRRELWEEPVVRPVGVVESWDSDAILMCEPERHDASAGIPGPHHAGVAGFHRRALIGAGRALTRAHVDFEYLTTAELLAGLAGCYDTLLLPWHRAVDPALLTVLEAYVRQGGRIVVDTQFAFCDAAGRLHARGPGSALDRLFGAWTEAVHDGRTGGPGWRGTAVGGFWADLGGDGEVLASFDDGRPAVVRRRHGDGEAILCALDPALAAVRPGCDWAEELIAWLCRTGPPSWTSSLPQTVLRRTAAADHWFLHNPGPAPHSALIQSDRRYATVRDAIDGRDHPITAGGFTVVVPAGSARWIRAEQHRS